MRLDLWDYLLLGTILVHLWYSPFTKVEESFTIQAVHDILKYGIYDIAKFDHLQFPGVVPRTFIGSLIIALFTKPLAALYLLFSRNESIPVDGLYIQYLARCVIGFSNGIGLLVMKHQAQLLIDRHYAAANSKKSDESRSCHDKSFIGAFFTLFTVSQFHLMFYSSRPLPNFVMALPIANFAFALVLAHKFGLALALLGFASVIFRLELVALTAGVALSLMHYKKYGLRKVVKASALGAMVGATASIFVDSYFWRTWTFPEMDAFLFNVIDGKSAKWGTLPFYSYLTTMLPMLFIPPTVLVLDFMGFRAAPQELKVLTEASIFHILVLSFQPHKEWRFIVYSIPALTLLASYGASRIFKMQRVKGVSILKLIIIFSLLVSGAISALFSSISATNYPGGEALSQFNDYVLRNSIANATVHLDVPVCMTGATLFGQLDDTFGVKYDKTEGFEDLKRAWPSFDYLITSQSDLSSYELAEDEDWEVLLTTKAFSGLDLSYFGRLAQFEIQNSFPLARQLLHERSMSPLFKIVRDSITADSLFTFRKKTQN